MDWEAIRSEFPITRNYNFQNHAAVAPLSRRCAAAMRTYIQHAEENCYLKGGFYRHAEHVRQLAAQLIGANPDEVTFVKNTSEGISLVANGLSFSSGDNIVTTHAEFPANIYPWQALQSRGVQLRMVMEEDGRVPLDRLLASIDNRTRLVTISSVQFASGFQTDLAALSAACQQKGVFLFVDAIQSLGVMPLDVSKTPIDFLSADGHKWLCGPEGLGIFYVRKEVQGHLRPTCIGWMSMKDAQNYDRYRFEFQDSIKRYDSGAYNLAGIYGLGGSLELLLEIGIDAISQHVLMLTDRLVGGLRDKGYRIVSSRAKGEASSIVAFTSDLHDHDVIRRHLEQEHRLVIAVRAGRLRSSPHFYNSTREIDQLVDLLPAH
jgi:selenocysteine lyase/cysteine desulfurase